ncbi:MAG: 4Fe-4S dicluster domain-containing protein [Desulfobaccales bacterium]
MAIEKRDTGVEIIIDKEKCRYSMYDPTGCKKCLQACGACVIATRPKEKRDFTIPKEQRVDPEIWVLVTPWPDYCTACGSCIESCEYDAIDVLVDGKSIKGSLNKDYAQNLDVAW